MSFAFSQQLFIAGDPVQSQRAADVPLPQDETRYTLKVY